MPAWWDRKDIPSVEERLAYLEGRVGDQATAHVDLCAEVRELRSEMKAGFAGLRTALEARFTAIDARFVAADAKMTWLIGIQVGMLLMIASAALGYFFK